MRAPVTIDGPSLRLRLVEPGDAPYLFALRTDPEINAHLSEVTGTAEDQRRWIEAYKAREAAGEEAYYIIERQDGTACGTVRLYGIEADRFTWGSWILDANKPPKAALESALLSFGVGFEVLGKKRARIEVRRENEQAIAFYRRYKMRQTSADHEYLYFEYDLAQFTGDRDLLMSHLANPV